MASKYAICKGYKGHEGTCNTRDLTSNMHKVKSPKGNYIYLCKECYDRQAPYHIENSVKVNQPKAHGFTYSIEMEMSNHAHDICRYLQSCKWLPTYDCTVAMEYKSPIFESLNGIAKTLRTLETHLDDSYFLENTGTHNNIGHCDLNSSSLAWIARFYHSLFTDLSQLMLRNPEACVKIYGRCIGEVCGNTWANAIDKNTDAYNHRNFINMEHNTHIEFRTCKFINARQYVDLMHLNTSIVQCVLTNFIEHFNKDIEEIDQTRYENITQYRKHKALMTSKKICKLFTKEAKKHGIELI